MSKLILSTLFLALYLVSTAQLSLRENQFEGYLIDSNGEKSEVIIEVEDITQPWSFQQDIMYFDKSLATGARVKREFKKHALAGDFIEYGIPNRKFVHVNYYIKGESDNNIFTTKLNKFKDETVTDFFAEVIDDRSIQVLKFHVPVEEVEEEAATEDKSSDTESGSVSTYDILLQREGHKAQSINDISFKDFFSDCSFVFNKYKEEKYRVKPRKGLGKITKSNEMLGAKLESATERIIQDFHLKCGK